MRESGVLLLDKPAGMTSAQAVARVKRALAVKKIGHAGTLDPMATGLLVLLLNGATRLAQYAEAGTKKYTGTIRLGVRSSTDDVTGELEESGGTLPMFSEIQACISQFVGKIEQVPPQVSAVKVAGKRAYAKARAGESFSISPRLVQVKEFDISEQDESTFAFEIICSKGTYIRSIARDLGEQLKCGACLASLRREASYPFMIDYACTLAEVNSSHVQPWEVLFPKAQKILVSEHLKSRLLVGDSSELANDFGVQDSQLAIYVDAENSNALGLLQRQSDAWKIAVNGLSPMLS